MLKYDQISDLRQTKEFWHDGVQVRVWQGIVEGAAQGFVSVACKSSSLAACKCACDRALRKGVAAALGRAALQLPAHMMQCRLSENVTEAWLQQGAWHVLQTTRAPAL